MLRHSFLSSTCRVCFFRRVLEQGDRDCRQRLGRRYVPPPLNPYLTISCNQTRPVPQLNSSLYTTSCPTCTRLHPTAEVADPHSEDQPQQNTFRPSRKVREPPGGKSTINFAWGEHEEEDALSMAPPKPDGGKEEVLKHTERDSFGFVVGK
jgi:hypothetical protein